MIECFQCIHPTQSKDTETGIEHTLSKLLTAGTKIIGAVGLVEGRDTMWKALDSPEDRDHENCTKSSKTKYPAQAYGQSPAVILLFSLHSCETTAVVLHPAVEPHSKGNTWTCQVDPEGDCENDNKPGRVLLWLRCPV